VIAARNPEQVTDIAKDHHERALVSPLDVTSYA